MIEMGRELRESNRAWERRIIPLSLLRRRA